MPHLAFCGRIVIAPDTPGYGASAPPPGPVVIADYATEIWTLLGALANSIPELSPHSVDLLGYHTGSAIATQMAVSHPDRVNALVLVSLPAFDEDTRIQKLAAIKGKPVADENGTHLADMWKICRSLTDSRADLDWLSRSVVENLRSGRRAFWGYDAVYRYDMRAALRQVNQPTLVLNAHDDLFEITSQTAALIGNAEICELPGTRHGMFSFMARQIAERINSFLDSNT